jgi:Acetyltransferase (GNAT) domain
MDTRGMVERSGATVETYGHPRDLPHDARALLDVAESMHVEFGADWFANLVDTVFGDDSAHHQVKIWVLRRQGRVLAVLPAVLQIDATGRHVHALTSFYTALFAPALAPDLEAEDLLPLTRTLREASSAATYRFAPMSPADPSFDLLKRALQMVGLSVHEYFAFGNWYEPVSQNWREYLQSRGGQLRSTIKRMGKKFAAEGGRLEIITGGVDLEAGLAAYQAVYAQSWKLPEPYPDFVPGMVRTCARRGWLRLGVAWLGDKPVAAQIWIVANRRADIYKLAFDEAHKGLAPGTLLTALLMERALDVDGVAEIDYLIGDDPYKATWMSHRRERYGLVAYDPRTLRGRLGMVRQAFGRLWRLLRPSRPTPPQLTADNSLSQP